MILRRLDDAAYPEPELAADEAWWHDVVTSTDGSDVEWMAAEDPLFILYTSGSAFAASFPFCLISIRGFWTYRSTRGPFVAPRFERCPVASPTPSDAPWFLPSGPWAIPEGTPLGGSQTTPFHPASLGTSACLAGSQPAPPA